MRTGKESVVVELSIRISLPGANEPEPDPHLIRQSFLLLKLAVPRGQSDMEHLFVQHPHRWVHFLLAEVGLTTGHSEF